jgi:integrase
LARRLIAIGRAHTERNFANPVSDPRVKTTFRGIKRTFGTAQKQAIPLLDFQLRRVVGKCGNSLADMRDRALLMIGFAAALRRAELVALRVEDLQLSRRGLVLTISYSKTDQERRGRKLAIPRAEGKFCPVRTLNTWLRASGIANGPVFRRIDRNGHLGQHALHPSMVGIILRKRLTLAGLDATGFSAHSLRAGLATSAARAGVPSWKIRQQTGHKSDAALARYIRDQQIFENNASAAVFLRLRRSYAKFAH